MYSFERSSLQEQGAFYEAYVQGLSSRYDDFMEHHILESDIYSVLVEGRHSGYFGIYKDDLITQFVMENAAFGHAQGVFGQVLEQFGVRQAFVPTCDNAFLSLCMDRHSKVELQAYFFEDSGRTVRPAEYSRELLVQAKRGDLEEIVAVAGDFLDHYEKRIEDGELYILRENGEFLGLGVIVDNKVMKNCKGTGMFTSEKHRMKGVGRSIILHLKELCYEMGAIPVPGCWYYNHNSKRTLESAGYISRTRLLKIQFG